MLDDLYIAGDTVWYEGVAETIARYRPRVAVVNAGGAEFIEGGLIVMGVDDVARSRRASPIVVAVHMEAVNHCHLTRDALRQAVPGVLVPEDGETLDAVLRGQLLASAQFSPAPTSTASGGSRSKAPHISSCTSSPHVAHLGLGHLEQQLVVHLEDESRAAPLVTKAPWMRDHRHLDDVGVRALHDEVHGQPLPERAGLRGSTSRISGTGRRRPSRVVT